MSPFALLYLLISGYNISSGIFSFLEDFFIIEDTLIFYNLNQN